MQFTIKDRIITCDPQQLIGYNNDYVANFDFDEEWEGITKTARFLNCSRDEYVDVILTNDSCSIPIETLKCGAVIVGVYSANMTTTRVRCPVDRSIKDDTGTQANPPNDVYEQLTGHLDEIEAEIPTQVATEVEAYVTEHQDELKGDQGEAGQDGYTPVRGTDYWTTADQEQIVDEVLTSEEIQQVQADVQTANDTAEEAEVIARGKARSKVFDTEALMQTWISDIVNKGYLQIGDNLYIKEIDVPDYFVTEVLNTPNESGYYYEISPLGSEVPDLTDYVKNTDYATSDRAGIAKFSSALGLLCNSNGYAYVAIASGAEIDSRTGQYKSITPSNLDYAVRSVLPLTSNTEVATLVAQTEYYLGEKATLTYALPATGTLGQYCFVSFISGTTATVLTVSGTVVGDTITPVASKTYEILYTWNGSAWVCSHRAY